MPEQKQDAAPAAASTDEVVFSDNVPQQVSHAGHYYIQIDLEPGDFLAQAVAGADR